MENDIQRLALELIRLSSFNSFDGPLVADALEGNRKLWRAAIITRMDSLIQLRDLPDGHWNVDTLFILPAAGDDVKTELELLVLREFGADEVHWLGGPEEVKMCGMVHGRNPSP